MKNKLLCILTVPMLVLSACSGSVPIATIQVQEESIAVPTTTYTLTPEPSDTPPPPPTSTSTLSIDPTLIVAPTLTSPPATPTTSNGDYDIFNVKIDYPNRNEARISFSYRINKYELTRLHAIGPLLPSSCPDFRSSPYPDLFIAPKNTLRGNGNYTYTIKSQGRCDLSSFYLAIFYMENTGRWPSMDDIVYRKRVDLPLKVVRDLPVVNSKTLAVKNFAFQTTGSWAGKLTFDYAFSPDLADLAGRYWFNLDGIGDILFCDIHASGPVIAKLEGTYEINIDLRKTLKRESNGIDCLDKLDTYNSLTYDQLMLTFDDGTYQQGIDLSITFKRQP